MAKKSNSRTQAQKDAETEAKLRADSKVSDAGDAPQEAPKSAYPKNSDNGAGAGREPQVGEPVTSTFDERTSTAQPFLMADGRQDNGARDLDAPEGAKGATSREGDNTTVEETDKAIEEGTVEGGKQVVPGDPTDLEKPKNPVN